MLTAQRGDRLVVATFLLAGVVGCGWSVLMLVTLTGSDRGSDLWVFGGYAGVHVVPGLVGGLLRTSFFEYGRAGERLPTEDRRMLRRIAAAALVQVVFGCLITPLTAMGAEHDLDPSWLLVALVAMGLGSVIGMLLGWLVALLVVRPLVTIAVLLPRSVRGDAGARKAIAFCLLLLVTVALATTFRVGTGRGLRDGFLGAVGMLVGVADGAHDGWLWAARLLVVAFVGLLVYLVRDGDDSRPG